MRRSKAFFILCFALLSCAICKADTLDYWHVYYNNVLIKKYNEVQNSETIILKRASLKKGDSITVKYFRDTPCADCVTTIFVENGQHQLVTTSKSKGTFNPVSFSLQAIFEYEIKNSISTYGVYYYEGDDPGEKILLFSIKLE